MARAWLFVLIALLMAPAPVVAEDRPTLVVSDGPQSVSVTVYRAPDRAVDAEIDRDDPRGYALITETRTVVLPAGRAVIRFEGVAGNILPESALVKGLPADVREKNLDADLLSPRTLYDRALGRRVVLRRTDRATGRVTEQQAIIRSSANGAAVLTTADGVETLRCTGLAEKIVYPELPDGLSARPTLSVETDSPAPVRVTIMLSYLAGGFDWKADYVFQLRPDGRTADLFAWVTLASNDVTSFAGARAQVVAGKLNRETDPQSRPDDGASLSLSCRGYDAETAKERPRFRAVVAAAPLPSPLPQAPGLIGEDIVVTGARLATQEALGDLKLYRVEDPVTIASRAQKQVGLLSRDAVPVTLVYRGTIWEDGTDDPRLTVRMWNKPEMGLGLPLPSGSVAVFETGDVRPLLIGELGIADKAVGEKVELELGTRENVRADVNCDDVSERVERCVIAITNANPHPIVYEGKLRLGDDERLTRSSARLDREDGGPLWKVTVPANGTAQLRYTLVRAKPERR